MKKVLKYLNDKKVRYDLLDHKTVYTALDLAHTLKVRLEEVVKNLLVRVDKDYFIVLLPASQNVNLKKLGAVMKKHGYAAKLIEIPGEKVMRRVLALKKESLSAFGKIHDLPVILEKKLLEKKKAIFSLGEFARSLRLSVRDFLKLEEPLVGSVGERRKPMKKSSRAKTVVSDKKKVKRKKVSAGKKS